MNISSRPRPLTEVDSTSFKRHKADESLLPCNNHKLQDEIIHGAPDLASLGRDMLGKNDPVAVAPGFDSSNHCCGLQEFADAVGEIRGDDNLDDVNKNRRAGAAFLIHCLNNLEAITQEDHEVQLTKMKSVFMVTDFTWYQFTGKLAQPLADAVERWKGNVVPEDFFDFANKNALGRSFQLDIPISKEISILCSSGASRLLLGGERLWTTSTWVASGEMLTPLSHEAKLVGQQSRPPAHLSGHLQSEMVNFIGGESGAGKTGCAMACAVGLPNTITLYTAQVVDNKPGNDDTEDAAPQGDKKPKAADDIESIDDQSLADMTMVRFINMIGHCICGGDWIPVPDRSGAITSFVGQSQCYQRGSKKGSLWKNITLAQNSAFSATGRIHVVFDEMGLRRNMIRGFCRIWLSHLRPHLALCLGCKPEQLYLIVAGAGLENFENGLGTDCNKYRVFVPTPQKLFSALLRSRLSSQEASANETAIGSAIRRLLYVEKKIAASSPSASDDDTSLASDAENDTIIIFDACPSDHPPLPSACRIQFSLRSVGHASIERKRQVLN